MNYSKYVYLLTQNAVLYVWYEVDNTCQRVLYFVDENWFVCELACPCAIARVSRKGLAFWAEI